MKNYSINEIVLFFNFRRQQLEQSVYCDNRRSNVDSHQDSLKVHAVIIIIIVVI